MLTGTASLGPDYGETELDRRRAKLRPSDQLVILSDLTVGQLGAGNPEHAQMAFDQNMGAMYPLVLPRNCRKLPSNTLTMAATILGQGRDSAGNDQRADPVHQRSIGFSHSRARRLVCSPLRK